MSGVGGALFPLVFTSLSTVMGWQSAYYLNAILLLCILFFSLTVFSTGMGLARAFSGNVEEGTLYVFYPLAYTG